MFNNITLTSSMRSNLYALKNLTTQMNKTQNRLASGLKVNSAIDNASSYYQARALNNRASDLDALLDSMGQSIQTITTAVKGLEKSGEMLEQAAVIAQEAYEAAIIPEKAWFEAQVGPNGAVVTSAQELYDAVDSGKETICVYGKIDLGGSRLFLRNNQKLVGVGYFGDFDTEVNKFSSISTTLTYNNSAIYLSSSYSAEISDLSINLYADRHVYYFIENLGNMTLRNVEISKDVKSTSWNYVVTNSGTMILEDDVFIKSNNTSYDRGIYNGGGNLIIAENAKIVAITGGYSLTQLNGLTEINGKLYLSSNISIERENCYINETADIMVNAIRSDADTYISYKHGALITIGGESYKINEDKTYKAQNINSNNITSLLNVSKLPENKSFVYPSAEERKDEEYLQKTLAQYGTVMNSFDEIVEDSSYQGINLITGGSLTTMFNENRTHSFVVQGEDMRAESLGIVAREWNTRDDIAQSIKEIKAAMGKVRDMVESLGNNLSIIQTRENFTDKLIDVLETGADDLVLADMNEESANYLALQTRNNLAVNALALAAQSGNAVLKLF